MKDLKLDEHTGLVLEGGGMRGVFTCGVLDYLMDHDIRFPYVIGVSAGACNALDYVSRQPGRTRDCMIPDEQYGKYIYGILEVKVEKFLQIKRFYLILQSRKQ